MKLKRTLALTAMIFSAALSFADADVLREKFVAAAKSYIGTPYRYGGISKAGLDCSGLVYVAALDSGVGNLPRTAAAIHSRSSKISDREIEKGDLVFFWAGGRISHVGIYLEEGKFIHSASDGPRTGVIISRLSETYWKNHYYGAGRFIASAENVKKSEGPNGTYAEGNKNGKPAFEDGAKKSKYGEERKKGPDNFFSADFTGTFNWSFFSGEETVFIAKGGSAQAEIRTDAWEHDVGFFFRTTYAHDGGNSFFQSFEFPVGMLFYVNDFLQLYAGAVFSGGKNPRQNPHCKIPVKNTAFPGIFGMKITFPEMKINDFSSVALVQDFSYTLYRPAEKNSQVSAFEIFAESLSFNTGLSYRLKF